MDDKSVRYLKGRFGDYYRNLEPISDYYPQDYRNREWGYLTWSGDWLRHKSSFELGDDPSLLTKDKPKHVYFSASKYKDPGASTNMEAKKWISTDLVFDLDADPEHFSNITEEDSYEEALKKCKSSLYDLLDLLQNTFEFEDIQVSFSGRRGYHVHVRDDNVQKLGSNERIEIADFVSGQGVDLFSLFSDSVLYPKKGKYYTIPYSSGWPYHLHKKVVEYMVENISNLSKKKAKNKILEDFSHKDIKKSNVENWVKLINKNKKELRIGLIHNNLTDLTSMILEEVIKENRIEIDEPVTTDTHRLMRFPSSLHGGSGLKAVRINKENIKDFNPLKDSIPEIFKTEELKISINEKVKVKLGDIDRTFEKGIYTVPEYLAIHLMCQEKAELQSSI